MRLRGKTYDFTLQYKHISKLFLLPRKENAYALVTSLSVPIRQGASRYQHLVMNVSNEKYIAQLNLNQEELDELYGEGKLSPEMTGELYKVTAKIFRNVIGKKIFTTHSFENNRKGKSVRSVRALLITSSLKYYEVYHRITHSYHHTLENCTITH